MGPACRDEAVLRAMILSGMSVARLNFSHGTHEEHAETIEMIRRIADELQYPLAILQDLCGPKVRIGAIPAGSLQLQPGDSLTLSCRPGAGGPHEAPLDFPLLIAATPVGNVIQLDDGNIQLKVESKTETDLVCTTTVGGALKPKKGVNVPGVSFPIESLTAKDLDDLKFGIAHDVDWIAMSFVRNADDVRKLRRAIRAQGAETPIIAKIEKFEAVDRIAEILGVADGIMVARGDLGVELPLEDVPLVQKKIILSCNAAGKPVITATQMLESMIESPQPTRAEVTDVCNAILDGTDAVMLSAETAAGAYPLQSVRVMARVAERTETSLKHREILQARSLETGAGIPDAISEGTTEIAERLNAAAIICATSTGASARLVSRFRPKCPVIAATTHTRVWNRLSLSWGVRPILISRTATFDSMVDAALGGSVGCGAIQEGDTVIITAGSHVGSPGTTNVIKVHVVGREDHLG